MTRRATGPPASGPVARARGRERERRRCACSSHRGGLSSPSTASSAPGSLVLLLEQLPERPMGVNRPPASSQKQGRANPMITTTATPILPTLHVGLDVAKLTLEVDLAGRRLALPNTAAGHRSLLAHLHRWHTRTGQSGPTWSARAAGATSARSSPPCKPAASRSACTTPPACAPSPVPRAGWPRPTRWTPPS